MSKIICKVCNEEVDTDDLYHVKPLSKEKRMMINIFLSALVACTAIAAWSAVFLILG